MRQIGHIQRFTSDQVTGLFRDAGFQVTKVRHTDFLVGQIFDYLFFRELERAADPAQLWAAQGLELQNRNLRSYLLCAARVVVSAITWCEWRLRNSKRGSMGMIITVEKD